MERVFTTMKITIEPYSGGKYTAECDAEQVSEVVRMFKGLLVQSGYHPETVDQLFTEEESWFPDEVDYHHLIKNKQKLTNE